MSITWIIALAFVAFAFGAICGALVISMLNSNDRYDECEACKEYFGSIKEEGRIEMTNRDYINSLSNEELANYIYDVISVVGKDAKDSRQGVAEWLSMPKGSKYARAENCKMAGSFSECLKCGACGRLFKNGYLVE